MTDNRTLPVGGFQANYIRLRDEVAARQIADKGKTGVITTPTGTPANPWEPATGSTETSVTVAEIGLDLSDRDGTLVEEGDVMFLVSTDGDPSVDLAQTLTVEGVTYQVVGINPVRVGSVLVLWKAHCRK